MSSGAASGQHLMTVPDLEPASCRLAALLPGVPDSALDAPTPCADTTVAALLDHIMGLAEGLRASARKEPTEAPVASAEHLDPRWRELLPPRLDALVAAWREPGAGEGTTTAGGIELPAAEVAAVTLDELVIHGWDLARATGQPYEPDPGGRRGDPCRSSRRSAPSRVCRGCSGRPSRCRTTPRPSIARSA